MYLNNSNMIASNNNGFLPNIKSRNVGHVSIYG